MIMPAKKKDYARKLCQYKHILLFLLRFPNRRKNFQRRLLLMLLKTDNAFPVFFDVLIGFSVIRSPLLFFSQQIWSLTEHARLPTKILRAFRAEM